MYRQSAYGRVNPRRSPIISVPENYSGNAFKQPLHEEPEPEHKIYEALPESVREEPAVEKEVSLPVHSEPKQKGIIESLLGGIGEKLSGDGLILMLVLLVLIGGGGKNDDGALIMILILLLL